MKRVLAVLMALCLAPGAALAGFEGKFLAEGETVVETENTYRSQEVAIEITSMRAENSDVYVADIYIRSAESLQRGFAGGAWGKTTRNIGTTAQENDAIIAITGDSSQNFTAGWVIGNGVVYRSSRNRKRDLCLIDRTGAMKTLQAEEIDNDAIGASADKLWQSFLFGPALLDGNGDALEDFSESNVKYANPRSAIGYYEPGHYCFVQVDGRGTASALSEKSATNRGMTLEQLAALMESLGCAAAYNLDGGQSAALWFNGEVISAPYKGGRGIGDIVMIVEEE